MDRRWAARSRLLHYARAWPGDARLRGERRRRRHRDRRRRRPRRDAVTRPSISSRRAPASTTSRCRSSGNSSAPATPATAISVKARDLRGVDDVADHPGAEAGAAAPDERPDAHVAAADLLGRHVRDHGRGDRGRGRPRRRSRSRPAATIGHSGVTKAAAPMPSPSSRLDSASRSIGSMRSRVARNSGSCAGGHDQRVERQQQPPGCPTTRRGGRWRTTEKIETNVPKANTGSRATSAEAQEAPVGDHDAVAAAPVLVDRRLSGASRPRLTDPDDRGDGEQRGSRRRRQEELAERRAGGDRDRRRGRPEHDADVHRDARDAEGLGPALLVDEVGDHGVARRLEQRPADGRLDGDQHRDLPDGRRR